MNVNFVRVDSSEKTYWGSIWKSVQRPEQKVNYRCKVPMRHTIDKIGILKRSLQLNKSYRKSKHRIYSPQKFPQIMFQWINPEPQLETKQTLQIICSLLVSEPINPRIWHMKLPRFLASLTTRLESPQTSQTSNSNPTWRNIKKPWVHIKASSTVWSNYYNRNKPIKIK